ncbi:MAG: hypothetical protein GF331_10990 [Chitinivibrionales bacterium]|nr:hypothetical protein [Chitinivibrionales bacterium]
MIRPSMLELPDPPRKNDALFLFGASRPLPFVHAYAQTATEVVHGPSCRHAVEIRTAQCQTDGVPIVARRGGGGTVVLAPGTAVLVVVGNRPAGDIRSVYRYVQDAVIAALTPHVPFGLSQDGISDIVVGDCKVCGSSLYLPRRPAIFCYQASLLVDTDLALFERYLHHPPREPSYRASRSHADFCTTLRRAGARLSALQTARLLADKLPVLLTAGAR